MKFLRRTRRDRPALAGRGPRLRLGTWPTDATVGHLIVLEHQHVPTTSEIDRMVDAGRSRGLRAIRTGALFPEAAEMLLEHGFAHLDTLMLLQRDLDEPAELDQPDRTGSGHDRSEDTVSIRRLGISQDAAAAEVDRLAFGPLWGYDRRTVTDVRRATPAHLARRIGTRRRVDAYAISGAGGTTGYLQRLAVRPDRHRCGLASALVADSLRWMNARGLDSALVNTAADNHAALALYDRFGFRSLGQQLTVAELQLLPTATTTVGG